MAIDIGAGATDRATTRGIYDTCVDMNNPAAATGILDIFEFWFNTTAAGVKVGTFSVNEGDSTKYTNRDGETIGDVASGSKQTFTGKRCDVVSGDYIGYYNTSGLLEKDNSGSGTKSLTGDQFGTGEQIYSALTANRSLSLYATGISAATVTTQAATSVVVTGCTGNGNITDTGGTSTDVTRRGFCYKAGVAGDPTTADSVAYDDGTFDEGAYTKTITGLTSETGYRVRAYCINAYGTAYGATVQVTTQKDAFDTQLAAISRIPVAIGEMILDYCSLVYGVGACTATATEKCFNTYRTCRAKLAYAKSSKAYTFSSADARLPMRTGERPYIKSIKYLPTEINNSLTVNARATIEFYDEDDTDVGIDPYRSTRSSIQGSFWKKMIARNPNYKGRIFKIYDCFVWNNSGTWEFELRQNFVGTIDNITFNKGIVKVEVVDILKKLAEVTIPVKLNIALAADANIIQTQVTVIGDGVASLDADGYIKIDDEIIKYETMAVATGILYTCTRGYFSTTAAVHNKDTKVQKVRYFAPGNGFDHLQTILSTDCGIAAGYIDSATFDAARDETFGEDEVDLSAIICDPEKAETIYFELVEFLNCRSWVGENIKIKIARNTPNSPGRAYTHLTDAANIVEGSTSVDLNQKSKLSRVSLYWDRDAEKKNSETNSFNRLDIAIDAESESVNEDNYISEKQIFCRWLRAGYAQEELVNANAKFMPSRLLGQSRDAMPIVTLSVESKDSGLLTGDYVHLSTDELQDKNGNDYFYVPAIVTKREQKDKNQIVLKIQQLSAKKFCIIAPSTYDAKEYDTAENSEREYGWVCDNNNLMPNGDDGYRIW